MDTYANAVPASDGHITSEFQLLGIGWDLSSYLNPDDRPLLDSFVQFLDQFVHRFLAQEMREEGISFIMNRPETTLIESRGKPSPRPRGRRKLTRLRNAPEELVVLGPGS